MIDAMQHAHAGWSFSSFFVDVALKQRACCRWGLSVSESHTTPYVIFMSIPDIERISEIF